ncbi:MAG TPA: alanine--glyoxylate aminotransferase family protein [Stenomitos sp.]
MSDQMRIMLPGPTPCPSSALREMSRPMINHRGKEFAAMLMRITEHLQWVYQTQNEVLILTTSGTGAMESAIVNMLSPGDRVLALISGEFGKRFAKIAETYGAVVDTVEAVYGQPILPEMVADKLRGVTYKAVLATHNETSTSILNPIKEISEVIRRECPDALILVDSVSGLGTAPLAVDELDLDVVLAGAQKAFMVPPGLAFACVSPRAWAAHAQAKMPRFYLDYTKAREFAKKGQTPWTPAISLFFALEESLKMLRAEGLDAIFARHELLMRMIREGARALGLRLVVENDQVASRAVTGIFPPDGIHPADLRKVMQDRFGYVVAGGQGPLTESIFRIGHCGYYDAADMLGMLTVLEASLLSMGAKVQPGAAVAAAEKVLAERQTVTH